MSWRSRMVMVLLLLLPMVAAGCTTTGGPGAGGESSAWLPAYGWYRDPDTGEVTKRWFGPLAERRSLAESREELTIRPLFSTVDDIAAMREETIVLWPLFQDAAAYRDYGPEDDRTRKHRIWLFPFFLYNEFSPVPGEREVDYFAPFPFVMGGTSTRDGSHFAVIPLGGTLKGLFGADQIDFFGGPMYVRTREGDQNTWYLMWPLIRYGEGPGYSSHAVLPLWAYSRLENDWERHAVLWPLVSWGENRLGTKWPQKYWSVLPIAARTWTADSDTWSAIPPFFNYMRVGRTNTTVYDAPWPFVRFGSGDEYSEFRLWPLYRRLRFEDHVETNVAWPLFWHFDDREQNWRERRTWVMPVWFSRDRVYDTTADGTQLRDGGWDLWPLGRHRLRVDGSWRTQFPAPIPPLGERFDRVTNAIFQWALFEGEPGRHNTEIFWGLGKHREDETGKRFSVFPFYWYESHKPVADPARMEPDSGSPGAASGEEKEEPQPEAEEYRILWGLFGRKKTREKTTVRLLWFITFDA